MKIAMLAPPWIEIPPPGYGGIEQVVALLAAELTERGNELQPDSDPSGFVDEVDLPRPRLDRTVTPEVGRPSQVRQITSVRPISRPHRGPLGFASSEAPRTADPRFQTLSAWTKGSGWAVQDSNLWLLATEIRGRLAACASQS